MTLNQCTLSGNSSTQFGGAIASRNFTTLNQCTLAGNSSAQSGGAFYLNTGGTLALTGSIIAGNTAPIGPDIGNSGHLISATGVNLIGDLGTTGLSAGTSILTGSASLAPLGYYGGPTQTMPPLPGSAAIDAAGTTFSTFMTDQRGAPRLAGASLDLGAVEVTPAIDFAPGTVSFQSSVFSVKQSAGTAHVPIMRTGSGLVPVTVTVTSAPGTATLADYGALANLPVTFAVGQTTQTVPVTITPNASLTASNKSFSLTITSAGNGATLGTPNPGTVRILALDKKAPTVSLVSPAASQVVTTAAVTVTAKATDDKGLANMQFSLNGSAFTDLPVTFTSNGLTASYSGQMTPVPGPNAISIRAYDTSGNVSATVTHSFSYKLMSPLTVMVSGPTNSGTVTAGFLGTSQRPLGMAFSITATPKPGFVFNGWTANSFTGTNVTAAAAQVPALSCLMQPGLALTANFIANPFTLPGIALTGAYNGLVTPSANVPAPNGTVTQLDTLGLLQNAVVMSNGTFTSTLKIGGLSLPVAGVFDNSGVARFGSARATTLGLARVGKPDLSVALQLDMSGTSNQMTGTVTQLVRGGGAVASSTVTANRSWYDGTTSKVPANLAGTATKAYALVFPSLAHSSGLDSQYYPQGDGYATLTVNVNGTVTLTGKLADNTAISASAPLAKPNGTGSPAQWPVFAQLYNLAQGCLAGMATLDDTQTDTDVAATTSLTWIRPYQDVQWYPNGWSDGIQVGLIGTKYVVPPATPAKSVIPGLNASIPSDTPNATLTFSDGLLSTPVLQTVFISSANAVTNVPLNPTFSMAIAKTAGVVTGTFTHANGTKPAWQGVILQKGVNEGVRGYFMTVSPKVPDFTGQGGAVRVSAN